jgi:NAD+ synthase (glutamine-hydrolysing)
VNSTSAQLRIGLAQINPTMGDLISNRALILDYAEKARAAGVHLLVFPEMVLTGYPVEDLALRATFRKASRKSPIPLERSPHRSLQLLGT